MVLSRTWKINPQFKKKPQTAGTHICWYAYTYAYMTTQINHKINRLSEKSQISLLHKKLQKNIISMISFIDSLENLKSSLVTENRFTARKDRKQDALWKGTKNFLGWWILTSVSHVYPYVKANQIACFTYIHNLEYFNYNNKLKDEKKKACLQVIKKKNPYLTKWVNKWWNPRWLYNVKFMVGKAIPIILLSLHGCLLCPHTR